MHLERQYKEIECFFEKESRKSMGTGNDNIS